MMINIMSNVWYCEKSLLYPFIFALGDRLMNHLFFIRLIWRMFHQVTSKVIYFLILEVTLVCPLPRFRCAITWTNVIKYILWYYLIHIHGFAFMQDYCSFRHHIIFVQYIHSCQYVCFALQPFLSKSLFHAWGFDKDVRIGASSCTNTAGIDYVVHTFRLFCFNSLVCNLWPSTYK